MLNYALVATGGAIGSVLRFWISNVVAQRWGEAFPIGTLVVNVSGSFLIGALAGLNPLPSTRALLMVGVCGGYTTFSAFSLQNLELIRAGNWLYAALNTALSFVLCMVAVWIGYALAAKAL